MRNYDLNWPQRRFLCGCGGGLFRGYLIVASLQKYTKSRSLILKVSKFVFLLAKASNHMASMRRSGWAGDDLLKITLLLLLLYIESLRRRSHDGLTSSSNSKSRSQTQSLKDKVSLFDFESLKVCFSFSEVCKS